jgi:predicted Zn-dependent protease
MLDALARNEALMARTRGDDAKTIPGWARTHPLTGERIEEAVSEAKELGVEAGRLPDGEAQFLRRIDGMLYGDDPVQGYVQGRVFSHPEMRISFAAPTGYSLTNTTRAVLIEGPDGIRGEFGGAVRPPGSLENYAVALAERLIGDPRAVVSRGDIQRAVIGGAPAVLLPIQVRSQQGALNVVVAAYGSERGLAFHFLMVSPPEQAALESLNALLASFRLLSAEEAASLRPRVLDVAPARPGDTVQSLAAEMAVSELPLETLLMLNDRQAGDRLRPGEPVKIVRYAGR